MQERSHKASFIGERAFPPVGAAYLYSSRFGRGDGNMLHRHNTLEVCLVIGGTVEWLFSDFSLTARPGQVVVVGPHMAHGSADSVLPPCEYIALQIRLEQIGLDPSAVEGLRTIHAAFQGDSGLELAVRSVFGEHQHRRPLSKEIVIRWCEIICLLAQSVQPLAQGEIVCSQLVRDAQALLLHPATSSLTISEAAHRLHVSAAWLVTRFKEETGLPPAEWLRNAKAKEARKRLRDSTQSISAMARQLGMPSSQFFSAFFKKETGLTPTEYRRRFTSQADFSAAEPVKVYF